MCRLLYVNSNKEFDTTDYLTRFAEISKNSREFQGHGWGCAYIQNGKWNYYKNVNPIWEDDFSKLGNSTRLIAHARSAFKDEGIVVENNMPFYDEKYVFIFNGELRGVKIKEDGRIGAEKIFNYIKRFDADGIGEGIRKGTEIIKKRSAYIRAMNLIIADDNAAYIYTHFNEDSDYFTMHISKSDYEIVVCSDPFTGELNWQPIENNSLLEIKCI
ncbi:MAG: class II glutamine amidotransferase [Melioribacter sp.]|nr:class II glutamine amidotransferase [Melioribacter sp.]